MLHGPSAGWWSLLVPLVQSGRSAVLDVRRREFIALLGGATAWPLARTVASRQWRRTHAL
jgi:hypothetical protein